MNAKEKERQEAIDALRKVLKPGDTVYTVLRHVSRSGMSRGIDVFYMVDNEPVWITGYVGKAIGCPQSRKDWEQSNGLRITGCGMDMGFDLVYQLSYALFPDGFDCIGEQCPSSEAKSNWHRDGGYALKHEWL